MPALFFHTIPFEKQAAISRMKQQRTRLQSVLGRALLAYQIKKELGADYSRVHEVYGDFGKPSIVGIEGGYYNISHSGSWVVCAFGSEEVGVDIEQMRPIKEQMPKMFLSADELMEWRHAQDRMAYFYERWVLKESYCKFTGRGLHLPLDAIRFYRDTNGILRINGNEQVCCKLYSLEKEYKMAVCSKGILPESVNIVNAQEISRRLAVNVP